MKLYRRISWITGISSIVTLIIFILTNLWGQGCEYTLILSNICIAIFGSSLLVCIPAIITFCKIRNETKISILYEMNKVQQLIGEANLRARFLQGADRQYNLDFSFENEKYNFDIGIKNYIPKEDEYNKAAQRVKMLYEAFKSIDTLDCLVLDNYIEDYIHFFHGEKIVKTLYAQFEEKLVLLKARNYTQVNLFAHLYEANQATIGQLFDIGLKPILIKMEPIEEKVNQIDSIILLLEMYFSKKSFDKIVLKTNEEEKERLNDKFAWLYPIDNIRETRFIKKLHRKLNAGKQTIQLHTKGEIT